MRQPRVLSTVVVGLLAIALSAQPIVAQQTTLLPDRTVVGIANTVSGARALNNLIEFTGYNHDRTPEEWAGTYLETEVIAGMAREYGFSDVEVIRYPVTRPAWDGIRGELWVTSPVVWKVTDFKDIPTVLASGSVTGEYEGDVVWLADAADEASYDNVDVRGKIVFSNTSTGGAFRTATAHGALGVVNVATPRPSVVPEAIQWSGIGSPQTGFAFNISAIMQHDLDRLIQAGPLRMRAVVESAMRTVDNEVTTAVIPGDGSTDEWVYYSAHLFEGTTKQGAADNGSGSVLILEAGRTLIEAMEQGYLQRPSRNMRFLWVAEFSGTNAYIDSHLDEFAKVTSNINIDMAGQNVTINNNATRLIRMPDSRMHYIGDVAQEFFEWVGQNNTEHIHERRTGYGFSFPIVDAYGTRDPWRYWIEPYYGSSDHVVFLDRGVPSVFFNHWPDMVYHTSHDRPNGMDATQMKRSAFIAAAIGAVVAGSPDVDAQVVAAEAFTRGGERVASQIGDWSLHLASLPANELAEGYKAFEASLTQWYVREAINLGSVLELTRGATCTDPAADTAAIEALLARQQAAKETDLGTIWTFYEGLARSRGVRATRPSLTDDERDAQRMVPNVESRPIQSRGVRAEGLPGFTSMEVRNFIDGERSVLDIYQAVNGEYGLELGLVSLDAVENYLNALVEAGAVRMRQHQR
jgi:hypothetical protein